VRNRQPNSRHCFVCGLENPFGLKLRFNVTAPGEVSANYIFGEEYQGYPGVVHGGIVAAVLDETAGRSHMGVSPPRFMYTAKLEIRYRKNVPVGEPLRIVGTAGDTKRRTAMAHSAIYDRKGNLLAEADAILVDVPSDIIGDIDLETLGWKVYAE
jgi:acyl-coenzyme A thioesterase PaaI-like protein